MKPECVDYQKRIAKSILGDLAAEEQHSLDDHLATCAHCRSERESYLRALDLMKLADEKPVPRHFFIQADERKLNPWEVLRLLKPNWQVATAALAGLFVLISVGWAMSFGHHDIDVAALKQEILKSVEAQNRADWSTWLQEVRSELARSRADLTQQQEAELTAALARLDSRISGRLKTAEADMKNHTQQTAIALYRTIAQQRSQDLNFINLRFDSFQANSALKEQQTNVILDTLLQVAELRLR
jgi:hypothetical protein